MRSSPAHGSIRSFSVDSTFLFLVVRIIPVFMGIYSLFIVNHPILCYEKNEISV